MSFDLNFVFGISGILLGVTSVILAVYFYKVKRYPGSIIYIEDQSTGLFNSLVKNFSEITITYGDKNVSQQIAFVKGYLINDGTIDINPKIIEQNLTLNLPTDFKWLSAKIVNKSDGNQSTLQILEHDTIEIQFGLFRRDEFIDFEALAEVPINEKGKDAGIVLSNNITFDHRIADTDKVKRQKLTLESLKFWNSRRLINYLCI